MAKKVQTKSSSTVKSSSKATSKPTSSAKTINVDKRTDATKAPRFKVKKLYVLFALAIIAISAFIYFGRGLFVAAVINGQPISRFSVVTEAEKIAGQKVLLTMITNTLIEQEAKKQNISVGEDEVNDALKKFEESLKQQGRNFDEELAVEGLTRESVKKPMELQLLVEKMVGKDVEVTDEEVTQYLEENREFFPQDQSDEELKKNIAESLKQQKLKTKANDWLASLQAKAKIQYFVQY